MSFATHEEEEDGQGRSGQALPAVAGLPASTRLLAWLTTSPWRNDLPLTGPVADYLGKLRSEGWMIRQASPRNFVLWRGKALYGRRRRLLVLPNREVRLRTLECSAIAAGLVASLFQHDVTSPPSDDKLAEADRFACALGFLGGMGEMTIYLTSANRKIQAALAPSPADLSDEQY